MAKAQFHRNQKVWVECVGAWAVIEKIVPIWTRGFGEPVRITYDVGLGREFRAEELQVEERSEPAESGWRLLRARNKWQQPEDCPHHPFPGTYPVVVTDEQDWGGWRVPGAEYDRDPRKIEAQGRLIAAAPELADLARELNGLSAEWGDDVPGELQAITRRAANILRSIAEAPPGAASEASESSEPVPLRARQAAG
ncbi:MAG TPA: hypothetical protein VHX64_03300 [Caulobacteraceae bacterium]|jgi:hypothetical protein|nr:hypothetical protein [Caulobacteraceae bacterium]